MPALSEKEVCRAYGIPVLPAYDDQRGSYWVFCEWCGHYHQHGNDNGHRIAHCHDENSPYARTGYFIECVGTLTAIQRTIDRVGRSVKSNRKLALFRGKKPFQLGESFDTRDQAIRRLDDIMTGRMSATRGYIAEVLRAITYPDYRFRGRS